MASNLPPRPTPDDDVLAACWQHTRMRHQIMTGAWQDYADTRLGDFFGPEVREFLPPAETSGNPALSITIQMATLYDEAPRVIAYQADGRPMPDELIAPLADARSWAVMQDVLESAIALNDCLVQVDYRAGAGLRYKIARPHDVETVADPAHPDQPIMVRHLELSERPVGPNQPPVTEWTWTTWDRRDPSRFRVEAVVVEDGQERLDDVTEIYWPDLPDKGYPYVRRDSTPIWPWVAYHRRATQRLISTYTGREIWDGTLSFAALQTFWIAGCRDGAHPQRTALDCEVVLAGNQDVSGRSGKGAASVRMNQMGVLMFRSIGERQGHLDHFPPAMDPRSQGEANAAWAAQLAVYAGIAPQDISISGGSVGMSGYAIALSRDGQRRARNKLAVPMQEGDRLRLSIEAAMLNAYTTGPELPEEPDAYRIIYAELEQSAEERKADREEALALREAGVLGMVDFYLRWNPQLTREQAIQEIIRSAREDAAILAAVQPEQQPDDSAPDDATATQPNTSDGEGTLDLTV